MKKRYSIAALLLAAALLSACGSQQPAGIPAQPEPPPAVSSPEAESMAPSSSQPEESTPAYSSQAPESQPVPRKREAVSVYSFDYPNRTYHPVRQEDLSTVLSELSELRREAGEYALPWVPDQGFLVFYSDGTKEPYYISDDFVSSETRYYASDREQRLRMVELAQYCNEETPGIPQWLAYMSRENLVSLELARAALRPGETGTGGLLMDLTDCRDEALLDRTAEALKALEVEEEPAITRAAPHPGSEPIPHLELRLRFRSGVLYELRFDERTLEIQSSGMKDRLLYRVTDPQQIDDLRALLSAPLPQK